MGRKMTGTIKTISDTAFWVAHYRAMESERPDAHFRDPLAAKLAGEHGESLVKKLPWGRSAAWAMIVRTIVLDEYIMRCIQQGATTIVNLAAGLDTRPYRLALPPGTRWVEVDLPGILEYKEQKLQNEKPVCELIRIKQDLSDPAGARKIFSEIAASGSKTAIVTEGLLVYLPPEAVAGLARNLHSFENFQWWLTDLSSPGLVKWMMRSYKKQFARAGIAMQFAPAEGPAFFEQYGWKPQEFRLSFDEAKRLDRMMPMAWLWKLLFMFSSKQRREQFRRTGFVFLVRT